MTIEGSRSTEQILTIYKFYLVTTRYPLYNKSRYSQMASASVLYRIFSSENSNLCTTTNSKTHERVYLIMEKITSFTVNHLKLIPGVYVSRKDTIGKEVITTFDLRMTSPNDEPVMNTAEVHTIEHLAATFLRNHPVYGDKTIYFGPMGCRTGCYLILAGDLTSKEIVPLMIEMFEFIRDFKDEVPGASPKDCGNYLDMNLPMANYLAKRYLDNVLYNIDDSRLVYPE